MPGFAARVPGDKKPTVHRFLVPIATALLLVSAPTQAREPSDGATMSLDEAVRRSLARPAVASMIDAEVAGQEATSIQRSLWPNPKLVYQRQQLLEGPTDIEESVYVQQRIDVSGRRRLRSEASELRARAAEQRGASLRQRIAMETRRRYFAVLHRQQRHAILAQWLERLSAAAEVLTKRETAGEASRYERLRLDRERRRARADLDAERAERDAAWLRLTALTGVPDVVPDWPRVSGALLPPAPPRGDTKVVGRPDLAAFELEARAARRDANAASRGWVPDLIVTGGWRSVKNAGDRRNGFVAGVSMIVPLFDHGQAREAQAQSERDGARARRTLEQREATLDVAALALRTRELRDGARRFRRDTVDDWDDLVRAADAGYEGGELSLLELLDAHRAGVTDRLRMLDLELAARQARIDFDFATGRRVP